MIRSKGAYWRRLDNAAKLFPAMSNRKDTRVFRFYSELNEEIQEEKLQESLERTLKKYPLFLSVMRKGLFWYYLEKSDLRPVVRQEYKEPCSNLYIRDKKDLLFEVTYYHNRINFEAYHVLTDGTGATAFIQELTKNYLYAVHAEDGLKDVQLTDESVTIPDHETDSFSKYYDKNLKPEKKKKRKNRAHQIHMPNKELGSLQVAELEVPLEELKRRCKELGVTMSVFVTAAFICAIHGEMSRQQEKKPVVLMVPVNLRQFFPSDSMLNFFNWIDPGYQFGKGKDTFFDVLAHVKKTFASELTAEKMARRMNEYIALEVAPLLRFIPLELKNICINAGARTSAWDTTAIFSNMGYVKMPEEYVPYIRHFGAYTSTPKMELSMCAFGEHVYLAFTSRYDGTNIRRNFMRILKERDVPVEVLDADFPEQVEERFAGIQAFKIFTFLCITAVIMAFIPDYLMEGPLRFSWFVGGGIVSMWITLAIGFFKRYNLLKNAMWQLLIITTGGMIWDYFTGWHGWSVDFVLPVTSVIILLIMLAVSKVRRHSLKESMIYYIMASGYGWIIPTILFLTGVVHTVAPTVICMAICFLFLTGLVLFRGRDFKEEMSKKLHF